MPLPIEALEAEILNLPPTERSRLLDRLIASLEADPEVEASWILEATRREAELESGAVEPISGPELLARLRADLG